MMRYYPIQLDIQNRPCLVVGGGAVGTRKVNTLLKCGAKVTVVSREVSPRVAELARAGSIVVEKRDYRSADLDGKVLVIGATNDERLNRRISRDAQSRQVPCNIVDRPEVCSFILPAIVQRGDLMITISTSGKSPALAKNLRKRLERQFGDEYAQMLKLMGAVRRKLLRQEHAPEAHKPLFEALVEADLAAMIRDRRLDDIDQLLLQVLGKGYHYRELMDESP
jgi:precorrin-2 dehydrogenase/sirohydrochlorin ferrochelatase